LQGWRIDAGFRRDLAGGGALVSVLSEYPKSRLDNFAPNLVSTGIAAGGRSPARACLLHSVAPAD
jgi:hypothetical protein